MPSSTRVRTRRGGLPRFAYGTAIRVTNPSASQIASANNQAAATARAIQNHRDTMDHQALSDLQAGKIIPFLAYAEESLSWRSGGDLERWQNLIADAQDKQEEISLSEAVKSGEATLEDALKFFQDRREQRTPDEPQFAELTKQIGDVKNAIEARDFNAMMNEAQSKLIAAGSTVSAKEDYLATLLKAQSRAKDDTARKALTTQIGQVRSEITKDRALQRSQGVNSKLIAYLANDGSMSGQEVIRAAADAATRAETADEANHYASIASQVATRERTLASQRLRSAASGGGGGGRSGGTSTPSLTAAASAIANETKAASALFDRTIRTGKPDTQAFSMFQEAVDRELEAIDGALPGATISAAKTLMARRDAAQKDLIVKQTSAAAKILAGERDADSALKANLKDLRSSNAAPEEIARAIGSRIGQIMQDRRNIIFHGLEDDPQTGIEMAKLEASTRNLLMTDALDAARVMTGDDSPLAKKLAGEYQRYRAGFVQQQKEPPVTQDEWLKAMTSGMDAGDVATKLGLAKDAGSLRDLGVERDSMRKINDERAMEVRKATDAHIAAAWPRDEAGARVKNVSAPSWGDPLLDTSAIDLFDPTHGGMISPPGYGAAVQDPATAGGHSASLTAPDQASPDELAPDNLRAAQLAARKASTDPHEAADAFLQEPTYFEYPTFEIPSLPVWSPFSPSFDAGFIDSSYEAPTFYIPPEAFPPQGYSVAPIEGSPEADFAQFQPPSVTPPPVTGGGGGPRLM